MTDTSNQTTKNYNSIPLVDVIVGDKIKIFQTTSGIYCGLEDPNNSGTIFLSSMYSNESNINGGDENIAEFEYNYFMKNRTEFKINEDVYKNLSRLY